MKRLGALIAAVLLTVVAAPQKVEAGGWIDGNKLFEWCVAGRSEPSAVTTCTGYVMGITDALNAQTEKGETLLGYRACIPLEVTGNQLKDIAIKFLEANPQFRHYIAVGLVAIPLEEAFPC